MKVFFVFVFVYYFFKELDEGFIFFKYGGDNVDFNDGRRMSEIEDLENETIFTEKLLRI